MEVVGNSKDLVFAEKLLRTLGPVLGETVKAYEYHLGDNIRPKEEAEPQIGPANIKEN